MFKNPFISKETIVLSTFLLILIVCLSLQIGLEIALLLGAGLFSVYALSCGFSLKNVGIMLFRGAWKAKTVGLLMLVIGMLTAMWRASGTIAVIVTALSSGFHPSVFYLMVFWSNALVSFLIGTSFGTSATMGVVCMTIAKTMGMSPFICGGAILSGIFVGDRCSPLSTSAMLVADLSGTKLFDNLRIMLKDTIVPFVLTSVIFLFFSFTTHTTIKNEIAIGTLFSREFLLSPFCFLPAILILIFAYFRIDIRWTMLLSILLSLIISVSIQKQSPARLLYSLWDGFHAETPEVADMLDGGGIRSMISVAVIVLVSSSYSGIFEKTTILEPIQKQMEVLRQKIGLFATTVVTSILSAMISCNQTFAAILVQQVVGKMSTDRQEQMLNLEDSVILISGLIPWCIAGTVPLATVEAPVYSMALGVYLYMVPLWRLWRHRN